MSISPERASLKDALVRLLPYILAVLTAILGIYMEATGNRLGGPIAPMSWGLLKDLIGVLVLFVFPWNGWIILPPLIAALYLNWSALWLVGLWVVLSVVLGIGDTLVSFTTVTIWHYAKGIVHYLAILGFVAALGVIVNLILRRSAKKCRR